MRRQNESSHAAARQTMVPVGGCTLSRYIACLAGVCALVCLSAGSAVAAVALGGPPPSDQDYQINLSGPGIVNPTFTFSDVPNVGDLTVSFGTHFEGQTFGGMHNSLGDTTPSNPLTILGDVRTQFDLSHPGGLVIGGFEGNSLFTTPLAIMFDSAVNYVSFNLGHLDEGSPTLVEAYSETGQSLGVFGNFPMGHSMVSLVETTGENTISGISIYVPSEGMDWEGFGLSNIRFGLGDGGVVPEPASLIVWTMLGMISAASVWIKRRIS